MKYQVEYYVKGVQGITPEKFNSLKEAHKEMIAFIDSDKAKLLKAGYKRLGSCKKGYIEYRHDVFGVESGVMLKTLNNK